VAEVSYQVEDRVAVVRLESPDTSNAFTPSMRRELNLAFIRFRDDEDAWVAVVCGGGDDFCAGSLPQPNPSYNEERERGLLWAGGRVDTMKPIIAALQGACAGEGLALALGCDLRIAEAGASFRALLDQDGGFPNIAAVWLVNLIGLSAALDILWTRESLNAESAIRMGFVNRLVRQGDEEAV
jgi:enoyl-CoA hydratase/carnithine racemase